MRAAQRAWNKIAQCGLRVMHSQNLIHNCDLPIKSHESHDAVASCSGRTEFQLTSRGWRVTLNLQLELLLSVCFCSNANKCVEEGQLRHHSISNIYINWMHIFCAQTKKTNRWNSFKRQLQLFTAHSIQFEYISRPFNNSILSDLNFQRRAFTLHSFYFKLNEPNKKNLKTKKKKNEIISI